MVEDRRGSRMETFIVENSKRESLMEKAHIGGAMDQSIRAALKAGYFMVGESGAQRRTTPMRANIGRIRNMEKVFINGVMV